MDHLARANEVRLARSEKKREIRRLAKEDAVEAVAALIEDPPEYFLSADVFSVVLILPRWGEGRTSKLLRRLRITETRPLGGTPLERSQMPLSDRERAEVARALRKSIR